MDGVNNPFSYNSSAYARYRPSYPDELVKFITSKCENTSCALDVGTGNGQFASILAGYFDQVTATDVSEEQLKNAVKKSNIKYQTVSAEEQAFPNDCFDLVSVAQAIHWFDLPLFYDKVKLFLKPGGLIAICGYQLLKINGMNELIREFYEEEVGSYWDDARKLIEKEYRTIPFPFEEIGHFAFQKEHDINLNDFLGYLKTWSAVKKYDEENKVNPVDKWTSKFADAWGQGPKTALTPFFLRLGRNQ